MHAFYAQLIQSYPVIFLSFAPSSPRVTGLSKDTIFGFPIPFNLSTCSFAPLNFSVTSFHTFTDAAVLLLGAQVTFILHYFLAHNIRIARDRAWAQTLTSRGKGPEFWGPYVEEWDVPPSVDLGDKKKQGLAWATSRLGLFVVKKGDAFLCPVIPVHILTEMFVQSF